MASSSRVISAVVQSGIFRATAAFFRDSASAVSVIAADVGRLSMNALHAGIDGLRRAPAYISRVTTKDPIDVASGEVVLQQIDVELEGVLPLVLERTYVSSQRAGTLFGASWASTLDQRLELNSDGMRFVAADGMVLSYPPVNAPGSSILPIDGPRWPLVLDQKDGYKVTDPRTGSILYFAQEKRDILSLIAIADCNENRIDLRYGPGGRLVEICHSGGYRISVETTGFGRVAALRLISGDEDGDVGGQELVRYRYDDCGHLVRVFHSSSMPIRFEYDPAGRLTRWIDRNGHWYRYAYDELGRCVSGFGSSGFLDVTLTFRDRTTVVTDSLGHQTTYHLNERGQVIVEVDPLGQVTRLEWDHNDQLLSSTDSLGHTTRYSYDRTGNVTAITRPDGSRITTVYHELGLPVETVDADGSVWRRCYDDRGNVVTLTDPAGATTLFAYDQRGGLTAVTDALGAVTRFASNDAGLPIAVTDPQGATTRYIRDRFGRPSVVIGPLGDVTRYTWTVAGNPASRVLPDGATERWSYDNEGNVVEYVDAAGKVSRTEYGPFDVPVARIEPDGTRLEFTYDSELRPTAVTNPEGLVWRYAYDAVGNMVRETDFNGRVLRYAYDGARQLIERTNGIGQTIRYTRDLLGNVTEQRFGDAVTTFTYDIVGRLERAVSSAADVHFERDVLGRVVAEVCNGRRLDWSYDALGRRIRRRTPSGAEASWHYDDVGRPVTVRTASRVLRFEHDPAGREVSRHLGSGATLVQGWDSGDRLSRQTLWAASTATEHTRSAPALAVQRSLLQDRTYFYRPDGNVVGIGDRLAGHRRLVLDEAGRVTGVYAEEWSERYAYDPAGRLNDATWPADAADRTTDGDTLGRREYDGTLLRSAGNVRYEYDAQGRVIRRQQKQPSGKPLIWHYRWDIDDRLVAFTTPEGRRWRYLYDALGRRIAKQRLGSDGRTVVEQTDFTWDDAVLAEQTHTISTEPDAFVRTIAWDYEPGGFRPLTQIERVPRRDAPQDWINERFYDIVTDLTGSPTEMVDSAGDLAWQHSTTLWGLRARERRSAACPLRFPGQYHDEESGLHYNYQRYYDPHTGRYQTPDPLGLDPQPDPYAYVRNPTTWTDPLGLCPILGRKSQGTATISWDRSQHHASIRVERGKVSVHTQQLGMPGTRAFATAFRGRHRIRHTRVYEIDLPRANKAFAYQRRTLDTSLGPYDISRQSCLTYCADVIREGGVHDMPHTSIEFAKWLVRNGKRVT